MANIKFKDYYGNECNYKLENIYDVYTEKNDKGKTCYYVEYFENGYVTKVPVDKTTYFDVWEKAYENHLI
jgi:hypothetical protein